MELRADGHEACDCVVMSDISTPFADSHSRSRTKRTSSDASNRESAPGLNAAQSALLEIGRWLREQNYRFATVTPETQRRINARPANADAADMRDVFGWSQPFNSDLLPPHITALLVSANALDREAGRWRSRVRFSTLDGGLYLHSAWPTTASDAVFFGPDTQRFVGLIERTLLAPHPRPVRRLVDVGCGSGAGGLAAARACGTDAPHVLLTDINPLALEFAAVNAALAGVTVRCLHSDVLAAVPGDIDLVIANPPYLVDVGARAYRHGGGDYGDALSVRILRESLARLAPGGRLILYTGAAVVRGEDVFQRAAVPLLQASHARWHYAEIDPDVFGEELEQPAYADVERIAAVGLVAEMPI